MRAFGLKMKAQLDIFFVIACNAASPTRHQTRHQAVQVKKLCTFLFKALIQLQRESDQDSSSN
jgi:hypothetical protein